MPITVTYHKEWSPGAPRITMNDTGPGPNTEQLIAGLKERKVPYEHIDGSIQIVLDPDTFSTYKDFIQRVLGGFTYQAEARVLGVGEKPVVDDLSYVFRSLLTEEARQARQDQEVQETEDAEGGRQATLFDGARVRKKEDWVSSESLLKAFYQLKQERLSADSAAGGAVGSGFDKS